MSEGIQLKKFALAALDVVLPSFCGACDVRIPARGPALCDTCLAGIDPVGDNVCLRCGARQGPYVGKLEQCAQCQDFPLDWPFKEVFAIAEHDGPLREAVLHLKFAGRHANAALLGEMLADLLRRRECQPEIVVAVPLSKQRLHERGYDQAKLLGAALAKSVGADFVPNALKRVKATKAQAMLSSAERRANTKGAFQLNPKAIDRLRERSLLLVDDVLTTGSTLAEAGRTLRKAEPEAIFAALAARSKL
ncbi:MAG: ComF family protein [Planctomycetes bacterium]|nr:ComF family protein [Planctomycetota bacterium]